jgi:hypothetical protein
MELRPVCTAVDNGSSVVAAGKVPRLALQPVHSTQQQVAITASDQVLLAWKVSLQLTVTAVLMYQCKAVLMRPPALSLTATWLEHACQAGKC